jgi:hypothetical protein
LPHLGDQRADKGRAGHIDQVADLLEAKFGFAAQIQSHCLFATLQGAAVDR